MRTKKIVAVADTSKLSADAIASNYNERGRLLRGEVERLFELAKNVNVPVAPHCPEKDVFEGFDNEQIITLVGSIGMMMIMTLEKNLPPHSLLKRKEKVLDVQKAMMELFKGLGSKLNEDTVTYWSKVWNETWNAVMWRIKNEYDIKE